MKIKKILAIILAFVLVVSFAACGKSDKETSDNTSTTIPLLMSKEEKQNYYNTYFNSADYGFAGNSIVATAEDYEMALMYAKDQTALFKLKMKETSFEIFLDKDKDMFIHAAMPEGDNEEIVEKWYKYKDEEKPKKENDLVFDSVSSDMVTEDIGNIDVNSIISVEYLETDKNNLDHLKLVTKNPDYEPGSDSKQYDIEFIFKDQKCSMTINRSSGGSGSMSSFTNKKVHPEFDTFDYTFNFKDKKMIHDETKEEIPFTIISKTNTGAPKTIDMEIMVDAKTHKISAMKTKADGIDTLIEFKNVDSCLKGVDIPKKVEECDSESLGMLMMGMMFSMMSE